jgi:signal transduction histidine kinase
MTRDEALKSVRSGSPHERLRAARYLAQNSERDDLAAIREARSSEPDSYVKAALENAISRLSSTSVQPKAEPASDDEMPDDVLRKARTEAIEWVTTLFLHEVASPFGLVANAASREVPGYATSSTRRHIDRVQRIFAGIEQLRTVTATPKPEEFDLAELIVRITTEESAGAVVEATPHGPRPLILTVDPHLLSFAIRNGLRNALEAAAQSKVENPPAVVVTWGMTDVDYWVAILDEGPGLTGPVDPAFELGKSTKQGHSGFGLAIARQAMVTLGGVVTLSPAKTGGARYELRWG